MICILKLEGGKPSGWILAHDLYDAMNKAHEAGELKLMELMRANRDPIPGKFELNSPDSSPHYLMLVS